jgi:hypothetical protein
MEVLLILYFVPTLCAFLFGARDKGMVLVINLFLGWTVLFWVIALALAFRSGR